MWEETEMTAAIGRVTRHMPVHTATRPHRSRPHMHHDGAHRSAGVSREQMSQRPDVVLLLAVLTMVLFGVVIVQSASQTGDPSFFSRHQVVWALIGGVVMLATAQIDYRRWRQVALPGFIVSCALLALVLRLGAVVGGAQRWLALGDFLSFQPGEIAKLAYIIFAAGWLSLHRDPPAWRTNWPLALATCGVIGILLLQNDLGTALVVAACALALFLIAGMTARKLVPAILVAGLGGVMLVAGTPFRRARLLAFLHPLHCQSAISYHVCQSLLALGSGGLWGRGLDSGWQAANYLPAPFTDSIYALIGEELGFAGTMVVLTLVAVLLWRGWRIACDAPDAFGTLLATGITCWLVTQAFLNVGSSIAATPFTGVPLPFISFGGSSLVVSLAACGILLNLSSQHRDQLGYRKQNVKVP
jgi:cell division protein FtsW (lipid II flippase)